MELEIAELKPDRNLIKSNFNGYRLSLESIAILRQDLPPNENPLKAIPTEEQFSFLHTQLFSMHNHLVQDPWIGTTSYYVSGNYNIIRCSYKEDIGKPETPKTVFTIRSGEQSRQKGDYNVSFHFTSERFCLLHDGALQVSLIDTGDRSVEGTTWTEISHFLLPENYRGAIIRDARLEENGADLKINFILQRVVLDGKNYMTQLLWYSLNQDSTNIWKMEEQDVLLAKSSPSYCSLESGCEALIICSNKEFKFLPRIEEERTKKAEEEISTTERVEGAKEERKDCFSWTQNDEDISVKFDKREESVKADYTVQCTKTKVTIKFREENLLDQELYGKIDPNLTTWSFENDYFQLNLVKESPLCEWSYLTKNGPEETTESQSLSDVETGFDQKPIANLEEQLEDYDFPSNMDEDDYTIERLNLEQKQITHKIILGNSPPIFSTHLHPDCPPAIVTRVDVDACVWLQSKDDSKNSNKWTWQHAGNLHAFGYVQASKQSKKFLNCSPDLSYAIICNSHRLIFIYRTCDESANELKCRKGPQISIGKQHVITLEETGEILGLTTANNVAIVLLENRVLFLQISTEPQ